MSVENAWIEKVIALRKELHKFPELSGQEAKTPQRIIRFITDNLDADQIYQQIGKNGLVVSFDGVEKGSETILRADMDALPIKENKKQMAYASKNEGISHKCGHDGHMAMVAGTIDWIRENKNKLKGKIHLLFQAAEETGQGASWLLEDERWNKIAPKEGFNGQIFGLHNLPGKQTGIVFLRKGTFACGSVGMVVHLKGNYAHAGTPETGDNPDLCIAEIVKESKKYISSPHKRFSLVTTVGILMGEKNFGISPGEGKVYFTLRTEHQDDLEELKAHMRSLVFRNAENFQLKAEVSWEEEFASTSNDAKCVDLLEKVCQEKNIPTEYLEKPMRWSEDFGLFTQHYPGAFFGLGIGENRPDLHHQEYDFNDEAIENGLKVWTGILEKLHLDDS